MVVSYGSILIARINRNPPFVKKLLSRLFKTPVQFVDNHEFVFHVKFPGTHNEEFPQQLKSKSSKQFFEVRLCWHGFILIKFENNTELNDDEKQSLITTIYDFIEFHIQSEEDLFEYDLTITPKDERKIFPTKTFKEIIFDNTSDSQLILSSVKNFGTIVNRSLQKNFNEHNATVSNSIRKNYAHTILLSFMISRSQYLRQFYASKRCTIVQNPPVFDQITNEYGNVITANREIFDVLVDPNQKFVIESSQKDQVSVISMDIVGFSKSISQDGGSSIQEQIDQFNLLSKWIFDWLRAKKRSTSLPKPGNSVSTSNFWIKCVGDGYIIAFKDFEDALNLAKYLQSKEKQKDLPLRVGLDHGTVQSVNDSVGREDLIGSAITLAVRIMSQANEGNIYSAKSYVQKLNDDNGANFVSGEDLGVHHVKHKIPLEFFNIFDDNCGNPIHHKFDDEERKNSPCPNY